MHYRQTLIDAAVAALQGLATLTGGATSARFFAEPATASARVLAASETLPEAWRDGEQENRQLTLQVQVFVTGDDVQSDLNTILDEVEGALPSALEAVSDCAYLNGMTVTIETDQDRESLLAELDYSVEYSTALGDPATRV